MANVIVADGIVYHDHWNRSLEHSEGTGNLFALLHPESCVVVIVEVYPPDTVKVLVLPGHHVHKNGKGFYHANVPSRCCPTQVNWHASDNWSYKCVPLRCLFHSCVYKEVTSPDGRTQDCCEWIIGVHTCQAENTQAGSKFKSGLWLDGAFNKRPLWCSDHLFILFDLNVLVEGLSGHWKHDWGGEEGKASERGGVETVRSNGDDSIKDTEFEFGQLVELFEDFDIRGWESLYFLKHLIIILIRY